VVNLVELKILVQRRVELSVDKVVDFVSRVSGVHLVVFHCSIVDDGVLEGFVRELQGKLSVPFVGVRVSASLTNSGFHEDSVVVGVFSGDFSVKVYHDKLDFDNPERTIEAVVSKLPEKGLCLAYAASFPTKGVYLDHILRDVNSRRPGLQFSGIVSSVMPFVFSNDGVFREDLVYCVMEKVGFDFMLASGLEFQKDGKEYAVTKASEYAIQGIDGMNAVSLYCGLKHVRPYFVNTVVGVSGGPDWHKMLRSLSVANETIYEVVVKGTMDLMGSLTAKGLVEVTFILNFDESKSEWLTLAYRPVGVKLRWIENKAENQLALYAKINEKLGNSRFIFGHECVYRLLWMNFRIKDIEKKATDFKSPLMLSYGYGEIGAYLPYTDVNVNLLHGGIMQVLGFR